MNINNFHSVVDNFNDKIRSGKSEEVKEWAREGRVGSVVFGVLSVALGVGSVYLLYRSKENTPRTLALLPVAICSCLANEMARFFRFSGAILEAAEEKKPLDVDHLRSEIDSTIMLRYISNRPA